MRTALFEEHVRLKGRMIQFGDWELPVQYSGVLDEHKACREAAGLFDVSHMGEFEFKGKDSGEFLNWALTNDVSKMTAGRAMYTVACQEDGGIVDDLVVYCRSPDNFILIVNAANHKKDWNHLQRLRDAFLKNNPGKTVHSSDLSSDYSLIAIQGRNAQAILQKFVPIDLTQVAYYHFADTEIRLSKPISALISRTGYTGEDGFEIMIPWAHGSEVWRNLLNEGSDLGLKPCGLAARDLLRIEMKFPLYGQELTEKTNPLEAGLKWVVKMEKKSFIGKEALEKVQKEGLGRTLIGFALKERGVPRTAYPILSDDGAIIGEVTSGTHSPIQDRGIGIGYIQTPHSKLGTQILIDCRGKRLLGEIVATPFYKRPK